MVLLAVLLVALAGLATWLLRSFDGERVKRSAIEWMQAQHGRELVIEGPLTLRLWPQPAVTVQGVRLSEPGQPGQRFATVEEASLTLHLQPLLTRREIEVDRVAARGVQLRLRRDADGRRNVADLMTRATGSGGGERRPASPWAIEGVVLDQLELDVADALTGVSGRVAVQQFSLGRFGPGLVSPLHLQGQAVLKQPALSAALVLDAGLELLPAAVAGAPPVVRLDKPSLQLRGQGFGVEALDARLQAASARLDYGAAAGFGDSRVDLDGVQLQFGGTWLGWQIGSGRLGLARLRLDRHRRTLDIAQLALALQGRRGKTTLDAQFDWPALNVAGESLQGGPVSGRLALGGDESLQLRLSSQAPGGRFERITLPALHVDVDGRIGPSAVRGQAVATLVLEPSPLAAALDPLTLALNFSDPALPTMQLALDGRAQLSEHAGTARVTGTINDQRVEARIDAALDRPRPFVDIDASFGTLDLNRFVAPANRAAAPAPTAAATPVDLQALQWADARLRLKAARLLRPPYRIDALDIDAAIDNGVLDLRRLVGRAWGGRFEASGSADSASAQLGLRLRADGVDLRTLLAETIGYDGLQGRGRIDADLRSRGATVGAVRAALAGRAALALQPAAIRGVDLAQTLRGWRTAAQAGNDAVAATLGRQTDFSQLGASFEIRDGVARNTDLDGRSDFLRVAGEGTIDFAQGRVDYLLRARVEGTSTGRAGPEMAMLNGVTVPVELHGPFGSVEWQVRWPAVTAAVAALSVPNAVLGTVGGVTRGATGVLRGAAGALRGGAQGTPPKPPP
ncbi:MAG: AsmA family protein [Piscinibacter sp.]|nr:AsmA family protein [Piscinibacter sp.]